MNNFLRWCVCIYIGRDFAQSLANIYIAALLLEQALAKPQNKLDAVLARNWTITRELCPVMTFHKSNVYRLQKGSDSYDMVFENYDPQDTVIP